jgi:ABC-type transporter Mla maintaining outer membrane lipid asymmetry ATPase subunit MlaF
VPQQLTDEITANKIALAGLPEDAAEKYRAQLSGGMRKRAALARTRPGYRDRWFHQLSESLLSGQ